MSDLHNQESVIRANWERGLYNDTVGLIVQHYGPGIVAFLVDRVGSTSIAEEVFSEFAERVLNGIERFEWRGTARSWAYTVARNAAADHFRRPDNHLNKCVSLTSPEAAGLAQQVRTVTGAHLRTDVKNRLVALRRQLSEEDQTILVLRLDREFSWEEIATVTLHSDTPPGVDDAAMKTETTRLRQRFSRVKKELRALAVAQGLLDDTD